jgi:hypothetical protein
MADVVGREEKIGWGSGVNGGAGLPEKRNQQGPIFMWPEGVKRSV